MRFYLSAEAEEDFLRIYRFNVERSLAGRTVLSAGCSSGYGRWRQPLVRGDSIPETVSGEFRWLTSNM